MTYKRLEIVRDLIVYPREKVQRKEGLGGESEREAKELREHFSMKGWLLLRDVLYNRSQ
jgi:hypothetical protein